MKDLINKVHYCDCLELLKKIPDKSVDMILQDPPYNTTACKWECDIFQRINEYWIEWRRVIKDRSIILLFGREPFTSKILMSNVKDYKHKWVWNKKQSGSFQNAKYMPLQIEEDILVFSVGPKCKYYPQMRKGKMRKKGGRPANPEIFPGIKDTYTYNDEYYPTNIIEFPNCINKKNRLHSTQKPVDLFKYLIQTYTLSGDIIFDGFAGSFTTAVAAEELGRNWICCDNLQEYCDVGQKRVDDLRFKALSGV